MRNYGLMVKRRKHKPSTTNSSHPFQKFPNLIKNVVPAFPNHIWAADITYIYLGKGFCYLAAIVDVFTRNIRGWSLGTTLEKELPLEALTAALQKGTPQFHHSDQGVQYCSIDYVETLKSKNILISMSDKGEPTQNPFAESFFRTLKVEEVYLFEYETIEDARKRVTEFIDIVYTKKRLHSSLGYLPPEEFEDAWQKNQSRLLLKHNNTPIEENELLMVS